MRYGLMYAVGHVCALLLPAWNEMPSLTPARNPSSHASALTSRSWAARAASNWAYASWDETMTYPSMSTSCVANMYSSRTSFRLGSLIVLVSFRQVRYHSRGGVGPVRPGLRRVGGAIADARRVVQHPRQLVHVQGGSEGAGHGRAVSVGQVVLDLGHARPVRDAVGVLVERLRRPFHRGHDPAPFS